MYGLKIPETCVTDVLAARCSGPMFEMVFGIEAHTNCTDTFAEAIGEFGLLCGNEPRSILFLPGHRAPRTPLAGRPCGMVSNKR